MTTRSPGSQGAGQAAGDAVVLGLLAHAEAAQRPTPCGGDAGDAEGHRVGAHRQPADRRRLVGDHRQAASATSRIPSGRQAVCFVSRNHELVAPDLSVNSPRLTECRSRAARDHGARRTARGDRGSPRRTTSPATASTRTAGMLASADVPRSRNCASSPSPSRARPTTTCSPSRRRRAARVRRLLPQRPLPRDGRGARAGGLPGPTDAWITLAGLARDTSTIRLGTLVTSATFRLPGRSAISVAQVDQMSGGRVELGLGAGWYEPSTRPTASRSRRSASASTASRSSCDHHRVVDDAGRRAFSFDGGTTPSSTRRRCPSRSRAAASRSSSAARANAHARAGRPLRHRVQPPFRPWSGSPSNASA